METGNESPEQRKTIGLTAQLHYDLRVEAAKRRSTIIDLIRKSLHAYLATPMDGAHWEAQPGSQDSMPQSPPTDPYLASCPRRQHSTMKYFHAVGAEQACIASHTSMSMAKWWLTKTARWKRNFAKMPEGISSR